MVPFLWTVARKSWRPETPFFTGDERKHHHFSFLRMTTVREGPRSLTPERCMIVVILRTRLRPEAAEAYAVMARKLAPLAAAVPGYLGHKVFFADDGEKVMIVEYESEEAMQAWGRDPDHLEGKRAGLREFFSDYRVQICELKRERGSAKRATTAG
jgi:heme-degrading monooxygenase HmoA